jgi:hypothetical protein
MTRSLYAQAAQRVVTYGLLLVTLFDGVLILLAVAAVLYGGPVIQPLQIVARQQGQGESLAHFFGVLGGLMLAILPFLMILPLVLCDRRYGLRCPNCCRSVTLSCPPAKVLRTGKCTRCGAVLFETAIAVRAL